ncbi:MAG: VacJ family lipoprotein [Pseudomonadaceae bacterium]|nr:VacJ family lipoprotein [Pseudomonadaceae bacterium]
MYQARLKPCAALLLLVVTMVAAMPTAVLAASDPIEPINRGVYKFNDFTDRWVLRPTAKAYDKVVPGFLKSGISNVFDNVGTPAIAVNQLLQGKPLRSLSDTGRFVVNTTLGVGGLIDVATHAGFAKHDEDFGQTLGVWGAGSGSFLMLPFLGPSSVRDSLGYAVDSLMNPIRLVKPAESRAAVIALYAIDLRVALLGVDQLVTGDEYLFLRDAYLQRRVFSVNDGVTDEDPFADDGFDDDGFDDE